MAETEPNIHFLRSVIRSPHRPRTFPAPLPPPSSLPSINNCLVYVWLRRCHFLHLDKKKRFQCFTFIFTSGTRLENPNWNGNWRGWFRGGEGGSFVKKEGGGIIGRGKWSVGKDGGGGDQNWEREFFRWKESKKEEEKVKLTDVFAGVVL